MDGNAISPFVDGALCNSDSNESIELVNPSTGARLFSVPSGTSSDVERAVGSARRAFEDGRWRCAAPSTRKRVLHRLADLIGEQGGGLDNLDAEEMGKPVSVTFCNAASASGLLRFYAEATDKVSGDVFSSDKHSLVLQRRVPRGVVAAITPWNFPTYVALLKVGPALAAGNSVVLKPSELSPRSAIHIAQLAMDAGLPPGVLNVVPGLGHIVGKNLGLHNDIDMVTFTGSTAVGKRMLQYSGQSNMKVVMAECGGKSPHIIFDDGVDLDGACQSIVRLLLTNQGQICSVGSRLLVQKSIEEAVVERVAKGLAQVTMGDARDPLTTFGPLVSEKQLARVTMYVESGLAEGALPVCGGQRATKHLRGYYFEPTVLRGVAPSARIAQEEIFGPVLSVISFEDEADAIRIANGTMYGLSAYVWTASLTTGMRMSSALRSSVRISSATPMGELAGYAASSEPHGQSGLGTEGGMAGMESYLRRQRVAFFYV